MAKLPAKCTICKRSYTRHVQKMCREFPKRKIRLCQRCYLKAQETHLLNEVLRLADHGAYHCPFGKPQCGTTYTERQGA